MPEEVTTTTTTMPTKSAKQKDADQDQVIQNFVTETSQIIATTKKEPEILPQLARLAFDEAELTHGEDLAITLLNSFASRQQAIADLDTKNAVLTSADAVVAKRAKDFRDVVTLSFADAASRRALGAIGRLPEDRQKRLTLLRTAFATAATAPYATEMTRRSYDAAELAAATADLDMLDSALTDRDASQRTAVAATATRNTDYKTLREWRIKFNRALKRARERMK